jgi:hypothetical protein
MFGLRTIAIALAVSSVVGVVSYGLRLQAKVGNLQAALHLSENNLKVAEKQRDQALEAEAVADAWAENYRQQAEEADALILALETGDFDAILDMPLDPRIIDLFVSLR